MRVKGANGIFAIGDCTATSYAPTAQVASQQGGYLARMLHQMAKQDSLQERLDKLLQSKASLGPPQEGAVDEHKKLQNEINDVQKQLAKAKLRPFHYSHQGTLAYIGSDKAIADLPFLNGNVGFPFLYIFFFRWVANLIFGFDRLRLEVLRRIFSGGART
jgi:NADH:ubiquinone reductase (non-electrogenic)